MEVTTIQVTNLLTGSYRFTHLGFAMLITKLKITYKNNKSDDILQNCTDIINIFIGMFKTIIKQDLEIISQINSEIK